MKIRSVGVELLHADRQTDRHDEANGSNAGTAAESPIVIRPEG
jgi:hypothetical protein